MHLFNLEKKMKKRFLTTISIIICLFFLNTPGVAQEKKKFAFGIRGADLRIGTAAIGDVNGNFDEAAVIDAHIIYFFKNKYSLELSATTVKTGMAVEVNSTSGAFGDITQIPIMLTGSYHLPINKGNGRFYLGAGVGYFLNDFDNITRNETADFFALNIKADVENSVGGHFTVGSEFFFFKHWALNLDLKGIFNKAEFTLTPTGGSDPETRDMALNAFVIGLGIRYYFK